MPTCGRAEHLVETGSNDDDASDSSRLGQFLLGLVDDHRSEFVGRARSRAHASSSRRHPCRCAWKVQYENMTAQRIVSRSAE